MENNNNTAIIAKDYRLSDILSNKKYTVDYFQREYKWEQINIEQLVFDLVNAFMESYRPGDSLKDVAHYSTYYMGSIVLSEKNGKSSIIDGQQRIAPSLYYPLYLAPLTLDDDEETCNKKIDLVAHFLDNFTVRRSCNYKLFSASSQRYTMCNLTRMIRGKSIDDLRATLIQETEEIDDFEVSLPNFKLHGMNRPFIKYFLARITSFVEDGSGMGNKFETYMRNPGCKPFEVEHVWSDHYEWHTDEFTQKEDFNSCRNSIGDLILLPNGVNQSYNDLPVDQKIPHYIKENLIAQAFCDATYQKNPGFLTFVKNNDLPFKSYADFKKKDIQDRCMLYAAIANLIWNKTLE